jgi:hypothetical protein
MVECRNGARLLLEALRPREIFGEIGRENLSATSR